ncbi:MAG TPA: glycosyl hydrolase family 28 protein, partial [Opitutaceae bacterium]|nr:glycosyl hydrolase family 28 protein [Opitutaceae bacterium]
MSFPSYFSFFCRMLLGLALPLAARAAAAGAAFDVADFGATGRSISSDTAAVQRAIDACSAGGGGLVRVGAGTHLTVGTIELRSRVELRLERGALLEGSPRPADYTRFGLPPVTFGAAPPPRLGVLVYADGVEDVAVTGPGRIDGNDLAFVNRATPQIYLCPEIRPFAMVLKNCRHVLLRDFSLTNSAFWTLRLLGCDDALIDGLHIDGDLRMPNDDGIDIDRSSNVCVRGCDISTGDDCISVKAVPLSEGIDRPCENVLITGCVLRSRSSAIAVGCDVSGDIHDVVVSDCVIR